ncbi:hypothetical protein M8J76_002952 [Diaphorina citri]|nr:hypothetical protein M8J76_002952 [Diaphorina citri]
MIAQLKIRVLSVRKPLFPEIRVQCYEFNTPLPKDYLQYQEFHSQSKNGVKRSRKSSSVDKEYVQDGGIDSIEEGKVV